MQLALGILARGETYRLAPTGPRGEIGNRIERSSGGAEMVDEFAERNRSDIFAAHQLQPRQTLFVRQLDAGAWSERVAHPFAPILPSVPARRRAMLSRCRQYVSAVMATRQMTSGPGNRIAATMQTATVASNAASDEYRVA